MNKHAKLISLYAQDWARYSKPWVYWEYCGKNGTWQAMNSHPAWHQDIEYRRKIQYVKIGGISVPEPCREPLEEGARFFMPVIVSTSSLVTIAHWENNKYCYFLLKRGLVHLTREAAVLHAEAMLQFTTSEGV